MPHEKELFPHDHVEPCIGKGKSPNHTKFVIWAFQLIDDTCPHLYENRCKIYENRPEFCRAYPYKMRYRVTIGNFFLSIDPECRALKKAIDTKKYRDSIDAPESYETVIAKKIGHWMMNFHNWKKKDDTPWLYNLETKEWEVTQAKPHP